MAFGLHGMFTTHPDTRDELVGYLIEAAALLEQNPDCLSYVVGTSDDPQAVWVCEVWTGQAAHDASLEPEDVRSLIERARPLITGMSNRTELTVHGGKGLGR